MRKIEFLKNIRAARDYAEKSNCLLNSILNSTEADLDLIDFKALGVNADTLAEAISCYVMYGEDTPENLWKHYSLARKEYK